MKSKCKRSCNCSKCEKKYLDEWWDQARIVLLSQGLNEKDVDWEIRDCRKFFKKHNVGWMQCYDEPEEFAINAATRIKERTLSRKFKKEWKAYKEYVAFSQKYPTATFEQFLENQ